MTCRCCAFDESADRQFTEQKVAKELARYRRKGPGSTTRLLRDGLAGAGLVSGSLLDVGAGFGALTWELLDLGMLHAVVVEASAAYLAAAKEEAVRRRHAGHVEFARGDFVMLNAEQRAASIVAMDRVVCCYPDYRALLQSALPRAERAFAYSYPRDRWFVRAGIRFENAKRKTGFRTFVHPVAEMQRIVEEAGFLLVSRRKTIVWSADVYARRSG